MKGFTLIEVLTAMLIASFMLAGMSQFIGRGFSVSRAVLLQQRAVEDARIQLKRITRSLREARPGASGEYPLAQMLSQKIVYYADVDSDDVVERISYELVGTELVRGVTEPAGDPLQYNDGDEVQSVVTTGVRNGTEDVFKFFSGDYPADQSELTPVDMTEVKHVQFVLRIDVDTDVEPDEVVVESEVQLRNLKDNLGET